MTDYILEKHQYLAPLFRKYAIFQRDNPQIYSLLLTSKILFLLKIIRKDMM